MINVTTETKELVINENYKKRRDSFRSANIKKEPGTYL